MSESSEAREAAKQAERAEQARHQQVAGRLPVEIEFTLAICLGLFVLAAVIFGNLATALVALLIGATTVRGYFKGAIRMAAFVVALIAAWILAFPIGRLLEGPLGAAFGTGGLLNRLLCVTIAGVGILVALTIVGGILSKRYLKGRTRAEAWDRATGAGLGFLEGALVGTAALWLAIALEPLAAAQLSQAERAARTGAKPPPAASQFVAEKIVAFAGQARESTVGEAASGILPAEELRLVRAMNDFATVSQDRVAMRHFLDSDAMQRFQDLESVQEAKSIIESDPTVQAMMRQGEVTNAGLRKLLSSPAVLRALDTTDIAAEAAPLIPDIEEALLDAKARVGAEPPPSEQDPAPGLGGPELR